MSKSDKLKKLEGRADYLRDEIKTVLDEAGTERDFSKVKHVEGDTATKVEFVQKQSKELDDTVSQIESLRDIEGIDKKIRDYEAEKAMPEHKMVQPESEEFSKKSIGQEFVGSKAYSSINGGQGETAELNVNPLTLIKTNMTTSAGWAPESLRTGLYFDSAQFPLRVADAIPTGTTTQASIVYMLETTFTNNAAEASEAGTYGEGALALTETSSTVRKIAVFLPVTDEQLEDVAQVSSYIDNRLTFMLQARLDAQLLTGNGSAPNLTGVLNVSGIATQAKGSDSVPDAIYKAVTKVRVTGAAEPDTVIMHPNDWQGIRLLQTSDGHYIWGSPADSGPERIWGLPVIQTTSETENTGLVGAFRGYSQLWIRRGIEIQVAPQHDDYFVKGKQAIRADMRVALTVYRATAFCTVTGI